MQGKDSSKSYSAIEYDSKRRFISYWHQIHEILTLEPLKVLEVGIGSGFVHTYLKRFGIAVTTCDYDSSLHPDIVAPATNIPVPDGSFDIVTAFEILEHLAYADSLKALSEFYRITLRAVVISLPDATRAFRIELPVPKWGKYKKLFVLPKRNPPQHIPEPSGGHQWEIGKTGYPLEKLESDIRRVGFSIEKTYRVFEFPYHRFFILKKIAGKN